MKKLALWVDPASQADRLFDKAAPGNRDDCLAPFRLIKSTLDAEGWECHTQDVFKSSGACPDVVLFFDIPRLPVSMLLGGWRGKSRAWVVLQECEVIKSGNWRSENYGQFEKVFTWAPGLADGKKYIRLDFPNNVRVPDGSPAFEQRDFCVMIAGNKSRSHPLELYSERVHAIRWFEKNHPGEFDLYSTGWDRRCFGGPLRVLNRVRALTKMLAPAYPSYKGTIALKQPVLERYKFAICYENAREIRGYITEKIFDCLFAGVIPVYWGAPDIAESIPEQCYVDRRNFRSYNELYEHLKNMSASEARQRQDAVRKYLAAPESRRFSNEHYAGVICGALTGKTAASLPPREAATAP